MKNIQKKNSLKVGDIVIWDEKNNEWNKLITKNNVDNLLSRMKITTGAGHDFYTSVKFFARMFCTASADIHVKTLQDKYDDKRIVYACGSVQEDPEKWKCIKACTKKK